MGSQISTKFGLAFVLSIVIILMLLSTCDALDKNPVVDEEFENITTTKENKQNDFTIEERNERELDPGLQKDDPGSYDLPLGSEDFEQSTNNNSQFEGRIHGGDFVKVVNNPHVMYLSALCKGESWMCGSSILNQVLVLTAAHCVDGCSKKFKIDMYAGSSDILKVNILRKVRRYIIHENYNEDAVESDIALIQLNNNLPLGDLISRVIIRPKFATNSDGIVAGWGVINDFHEKTIHLKGIQQFILPPDKCALNKLPPGLMCAYSGLNGQHPAQGDSGSGFISNDYQILGLVSFTRRAEPDIVFYSNVSYFYGWVKKSSVRLACSGKT